MAQYCGAACQRLHWPEHRAACFAIHAPGEAAAPAHPQRHPAAPARGAVGAHHCGSAPSAAGARRKLVERAAREFGVFVAALSDTELTPATTAACEADSEPSLRSPREGASTPLGADAAEDSALSDGGAPRPARQRLASPPAVSQDAAEVCRRLARASVGARAALAAPGHAEEAEPERSDAGAPPAEASAAAAGAAAPKREPDAATLAAWRAAVDSLFVLLASSSQEDANDLVDLRRYREAIQPRFELSRKGDRPVLITAPHCIYLRRDGHEPHLAEKFTREVGEALAEELQGSFLTWTGVEQRWSQRLVVACKRRCGKDLSDLQEILDPRNRDPNYLLADEVWDNPWFKTMQGAAQDWRMAFGSGVQMLHVDVHGCQDPPATPSHLTVGLGAMQECAARLSLDHEELMVFRDALQAELTIVLDRLGPVLQKSMAAGADAQAAPSAPSALVRVILDTKARPDQHRARSFVGAWAAGSRRLTQTQQAISCAHFTHAVQLELSRALRRALALRGRDRAAMARFANALQAAWVKAKQRARGAGTEVA